jgi:hypothetical protein
MFDFSFVNSTASSVFNIPYPYSSSLPVFPISVEDFKRMSLTSLFESFGAIDQISAAVPVT